MKRRAYLKILPVVILICTGTIIYSNTFNAPFQFDDYLYIVNDPNIKHIGDFAAIWDKYPTRFLTLLSLAFNYHFDGLHTFGYHLLNLIIHINAAILVWLLVFLTFLTPVMKKSRISRHKYTISLFTALIFLCHPVQTESVTYIWQRATSLAGFFYLLTLLFYVISRLLQQNNSLKAKAAFFYAASFLIGAFGMLTKESMLTLPLAIILYEFCFFKRDNRSRRIYIYLLFLPLIPAIFLFARPQWAQQLFSHSVIGNYGYFLTQAHAMLTSVRLLFMPINQNVYYDYPIAKSVLEIPVLAGFALSASMVFIAIWAFRRYRLISFAIFWYFLTIFLESCILFNDIFFSEHRLYLPLIGYSLFLVSGLFYLSKARFKEVKIILLVIVICYAGLTYNRNFILADNILFADDIVGKSPQNPLPYLWRASAYANKRDLDRALSDCGAAIRIDPGFTPAYMVRGSLYAVKGDYASALLDYNKAICLDPSMANVYVNRGLVYARIGALKSAIADYNKAIRVGPRLVIAYYNLGWVYALEGNLDCAIRNYDLAIALDPGLARAFYNCANIYIRKGDYNSAVRYLNKAIEINPDTGRNYYSRAVAYFGEGRYDDSWGDLRRAAALGYKINPGFLKDIKKAMGKKL